MSCKSRSCWGFDLDSYRFKEIFGKDIKPKAKKIIKTRHKDEATRGDFRNFTRPLDNNLQEYKRFKAKGDREKIKDEYFGRQYEYRKHHTFTK